MSWPFLCSLLCQRHWGGEWLAHNIAGKKKVAISRKHEANKSISELLDVL